MLRRALPFFLFTFASFAQSQFLQPSISPNGIVNAASNLAPWFPNYGIARGSMFLIFGSLLGPDTLVQATTFPLPSSDGLAGTRVQIGTGAYTTFALMVYTSSKQVAAILPSDAPEGDANLVVSYQNLTSNVVPIHIVRSAFGIFAWDQAGVGPAVAQNYVSATQVPSNTLTSPATPGQTVILWGTGLGPVTGNEAGGPLPGNLPYLDSLYVGGQQVTPRYAGRSGCCAGVDQVVFDIPAGVSGCYVPVAAVTNGVLSNFGTISVSASGGNCDDPLSFRAADLAALQQTGQLRVGRLAFTQQSSPGSPPASVDFSANFLSYTAQSLLGPAPLTPSLGSCYVSQALTNADPSALPHGTPLNAGVGISATGTSGSLTAANISPGVYDVSGFAGGLAAGSYNLSSIGGSDIPAFQARMNLIAPTLQWTNPTAFSGPVQYTGQPITLQWSGGDPSGYASILVTSATSNAQTSIECYQPVAAQSFTVPAFLLSALPAGQGVISVGWRSAAASFSAMNLDSATVVTGGSTSISANFRLGTP